MTSTGILNIIGFTSKIQINQNIYRILENPINIKIVTNE